MTNQSFFSRTSQTSNTVKLGDKEQISVKELFTDYQPFYTINLLLDKELLPIQEMPKLGTSEHEKLLKFEAEGKTFEIT